MRQTRLVVLVLLLGAPAMLTLAQSRGASSSRPPATALRNLIAEAEKQLVALAEEMPADKYEFVPTQGAFRGVRNFAKQVKHAAAANHLLALSILGEPITADMSEERGPDSVTTKADIVKYLKASFANLHRAAASVDERNAFATLRGVSGPAPDTRIELIVTALTHSSNHYGQIVEYLRMNDLTPPQ